MVKYTLFNQIFVLKFHLKTTIIRTRFRIKYYITITDNSTSTTAGSMFVNAIVFLLLPPTTDTSSCTNYNYNNL